MTGALPALVAAAEALSIPQAAYVAFAGVVGACIGSFCNVVIWRLPRGESVVAGRSHCPRCGHLVRGYDNVPIISWLLLRARCRDCKAPIAWRYPLVEALVAALFVLAATVHPLSSEAGLFAMASAVLAALVCVSFVDVDRREIPDAITKPGIAIGIVLSLLLPDMHRGPRSLAFFREMANENFASCLEAAAGAATGAAALYAVRILGRLAMGKEAMGLGDVKLLAMVGAFVPAWPLDVFLVLLLAAVGGSVVGGVYVASRVKRLAPLSGGIALDGGKRVPFSLARVRAPRRAPITFAAEVDDAAAGFPPGAQTTIDVVLPGETVWSDDGKDVRLTVRGPVERVERAHGRSLVVVPPELSEQDEEWLATFALNRLSIPFGVFLAAAAAAVLLYDEPIARFVTETWPRFVTGR